MRTVESKELTTSVLCALFQQTRGGADIEELNYRKGLAGDEFVEILYNSGGRRVVDVSADSCLGLIKDVVDFVCKH